MAYLGFASGERPAPGRAARVLLLRLLSDQLRNGTLVLEEAGRRHIFGTGEPVAAIEVRSARAWGALLSGSRGLADSYAEGWWDSPDPVSVIRVAARNIRAGDRVRRLLRPVKAPLDQLRTGLRPHTRTRSRQDIAAHYDLGNRLFSQMLDPTMTYSCAVFERAGMSLEQAQIAKLERVCSKLRLTPADHVLEIGTGWGSFALHAAGTRGCRVTTTTISAEQHAHATGLVRRAGLGDRVTVLMRDYRDLDGRYDKLVSIEMIEAVGWRQWGTFFGKCSSLLASHGAMLLQAITIDDRLCELERTSPSFIKSRIFPGGALPSLHAIARSLARRTDLQTLHLEDITTHYVQTLKLWRRAFNDSESELERLGYDRRFRRYWNLYLAYCEAGFAERRISDVQMLLAKPEFRRLVPAPGVEEVAGPPTIRTA